MAIIIAIFFVICDENDVFYILVEFESDRMSPRESAKNGRNGAHFDGHFDGDHFEIFVIQPGRSLPIGSGAKFTLFQIYFLVQR